MKKIYRRSLFIFRRDLRLTDNIGLIRALELSDIVIPCFIFDPRQVETDNEYRSLNCIEFMINSLKDLDKDLVDRKSHLYLFYGPSHKVLQQILEMLKLDAVFVNSDYTPFSQMRDDKIKAICQKFGASFCSFHDSLLHEPCALKTNTGKPYTIFTPFYKKAVDLPVPGPQSNNYKNYEATPIAIDSSITFDNLTQTEWGSYHNPNLFEKGGRAEALKILRNLDLFTNYEKTHDLPACPTTGLSAHNKFGTISIREVFSALHGNLSSSPKSQMMLTRQLYWRDFFTYIAFYFPHVFGQAFHEKYDVLDWSYNRESFKRWVTGTTGFPFVDAGMRQLNTTGFMHNRVRLIVASFLTKDLHIDWRWGEKYFAQKLIDYDPAVNNGNWQWAASTGCDAQPYFRIFNPWLQQKKFDADCAYIKQWIPELKDVPAQIIHQLYKQKNAVNGYPVPILDHQKEAAKAKRLFKFKTTNLK